MRLIVPVLLCFASALSPAADAIDPEINDLSVSNALGGSHVLETIRGAPALRAQRVDTPGAEEDTAPSDEFPGLIELAAPVDVDPAIATKIRTILESASTYLAKPKRCRFRANVRLLFDAPGHPPVGIVLCFGCGELEVWQNGRLLAFSPFDPAYGGLLAASQEIFPDDEFLKSFSPEVFEERAKAMRE